MIIPTERKEKVIKRFNKYWMPEPNSGCWLWTDGQNGPRGYGSFHVAIGAGTKAHRISYMLFKGDIPDGLCVCHSCDTPACVNPEHLWLGTKADNTKDAFKKGRNARKETHARAKLTMDSVRTIRVLSASGMTSRDLSKMFNVSETAIYLVKTNKTWT